MKRLNKIAVFILVLLMIGSKTFGQSQDLIKVLINGKEETVRKVPVLVDGQVLQSEAPAFVYTDRTLVPIRFIAESYGATVGWEHSTRTASIQHGNNKVDLVIDNPVAKFNGKDRTLDKNSTPRLVTFSNQDSRTMVPLAFVSEILGYEVGYNEATKTPYVNSKNNQNQKEENNKKEAKNTISQIYLNKGSTTNEKIVIKSKEKLDYTAEMVEGNKLIINAKDTKLDLEKTKDKEVNIPVNDKNIKSIEYKQSSTNPYTVNIIVNMNGNPAYDIVSQDNGKTNIISFVSKVGNAELRDKKAIVIPGGANAEYRIMNLANPDRIVLDLLDASLIQGLEYAHNYNLGSIKTIRGNQFIVDKNYNETDRVVRVVLDVSSGFRDSDFNIQKEGKDLVIYPKEKPVTPAPNTPSPQPNNPNPKPNTNSNKKLIVIDPGHGGGDPGAVSKNGTREKDINLSISLKARNILENSGYNVLMTRDTDRGLKLSDRTNFANNNFADAFVSFHVNSAGSATSAKGIEVLYTPRGQTKVPNDKDQYPLSKMILDEMIKETGAVNRGVKQRPDLYVLNRTQMPAALVEIGFLTNPEEERLMNTEAYQNKIAESVAKGIDNYFRTY